MVMGYAAIVVLTVILVIYNVRSAISEFELHRYRSRLCNQMATLLLVGAMLITVSYLVIDRTMNAAESLQGETIRHAVSGSATKA